MKDYGTMQVGHKRLVELLSALPTHTLYDASWWVVNTTKGFTGTDKERVLLVNFYLGRV